MHFLVYDFFGTITSEQLTVNSEQLAVNSEQLAVSSYKLVEASSPSTDNLRCEFFLPLSPFFHLFLLSKNH